MANSFPDTVALRTTLFAPVHALRGALQKINDPKWDPPFGLLFDGSLYRIETRALPRVQANFATHIRSC